MKGSTRYDKQAEIPVRRVPVKYLCNWARLPLRIGKLKMSKLRRVVGFVLAVSGILYLVIFNPIPDVAESLTRYVESIEKLNKLDRLLTLGESLPRLSSNAVVVQVFSSYSLFSDNPSFPLDGYGLPRQRISCSNQSFHVEMVVTVDVRVMRSVDAVLFNYEEERLLSWSVGELARINAEQEARNSTQLWIFKAMESVAYIRWIEGSVGDLPIHVLEGYHISSAIPHVYGYYAPGKPMPGFDSETAIAKSLADMMAIKTKLAVWCAKNCHNTFWPRYNFVYSLRKYMSVDIYGKCGNLKCMPRMSDKCLRLFQQYKFYLALENSECDDYITEKMWNALIHGIVPVVYGPRKEFYIKRAPPNSFIHIADFKSGKELTNYLLYLDKNQTEYLKYFEWRAKGTVAINSPPGTYDYCNVLGLINQVKEGKIKKTLLSKTVFYNSCRPQRGYEGFNVKRVKLSDWKPRK